MLCYGLIGSQHEFLDQVRRYGLNMRPDLHRFAMLVHNDFCLWKIKVNGTASSAFLMQNSCQIRHLLKHGDQITAHFDQMHRLLAFLGIHVHFRLIFRALFAASRL